MRKIILSTLLLFLALSFTTAQSSVWKVSKDGNDMYLAGTIHLLKPSDYPLPQQFYTALDASDVLYVEADMDKMSDPATAQSMMSAMMLPEGQTLQTILDEDVYNSLAAECATVSLPIVNLNQFKPSLVVVTLSAMKMMSLGLSTEGVDKHLMGKAKEAEKAVEFMETIEFQINLLAAMGEGNENNFVKYSLEDIENIEEELDAMLLAWKNGSSEIMNEQIVEMKAEFPKLYKSLLLDRNKLWVEKINSLSTNDKTEFIAVGALHLHGDDGLLSQLKAQGYKVKQLK